MADDPEHRPLFERYGKVLFHILLGKCGHEAVAVFRIGLDIHLRGIIHHAGLSHRTSGHMGQDTFGLHHKVAYRSPLLRGSQVKIAPEPMPAGKGADRIVNRAAIVVLREHRIGEHLLWHEEGILIDDATQAPRPQGSIVSVP